MLKPEFTGQFKRDYKLAIKRGCDPKKLEEVIALLCNEKPLPEAYRDHALTNSRNYKDMRECHIEPDWLLVYKVFQQTLVLKLKDGISQRFVLRCDSEESVVMEFWRHQLRKLPLIVGCQNRQSVHGVGETMLRKMRKQVSQLTKPQKR